MWLPKFNAFTDIGTMIVLFSDVITNVPDCSNVPVGLMLVSAIKDMSIKITAVALELWLW